MTQAIPPGNGGLIPHLVVDGAAKAIDFYKEAFGAVEIMRMPAADGQRLMHAEIKIGDQSVYLADDFPEMGDGKGRTPTALGGSPLNLQRFVEDTDAALARAEKAGATITMPAEDMFWGDRYGKLRDPFGHEWAFSTHVKDLSPEEMAEAAKAAFS